MLLTRRAQKLTSLWSSDNREDYALLYVLQSLRGPELTFDPDVNTDKSCRILARHCCRVIPEHYPGGNYG